MNQILVNTIIYGEKYDKAASKLDEIIETIDTANIHRIRKSRYDYDVTLLDGTYYKVVIANQGCRGYRFNNAYVDGRITFDILFEYILPCQRDENGFIEIY